MNRNLAEEWNNWTAVESAAAKRMGFDHQRDTLRLLTVVYECLLAASPAQGSGRGGRAEFNYHSRQ